ncbi:MAG TPA: hypothetical protein VFE02_06695 [Candidatus Acidoferrales bacterium]|jgi:hypothetical protein|nr:hypothetical protein [Candidatus Acidoferrales bacterium]
MTIDIHPHVISTDTARYPNAPVGGKKSDWSHAKPVSAERLLNVLGNSLATIVIARTEHAVDIEILQSQLKSDPDEGVPASAL